MKPTTLVDGTVLSADLVPETTTKAITKVMKPVMVTRTPEGRIANIQIVLARGVVALEIDEATARAIAAVFD